MIMLKNLIKQSKTDLLAAGLKPNLVERTLKPVRALLEGQGFWPVKRESLAIFSHSKLFKYFSIPGDDIPRILNIQKGFSIEPLKKLADDNKSYIVLTLGHNNVQLYEANRYEIKPIKLKGFPADMRTTLRIDEYPRVIEPHAVATIERGKGSHAFHGQYNVSQTDKTMLLQFFRQINRRLSDFLRGQHIPVVLAGVGYLLPLYQSVNTYPHLVAKGVQGSPSGSGTTQLHKKAWRVVSKWGNDQVARIGRSGKALK